GVPSPVDRLTAESAPASLEAQEFVLRDKEGNAKARLSVLPGGTPTLDLFDSSGMPRLSMGIDAEGWAGVFVSDASGLPRLSLGVKPDGGTTILLSGKGIYPAGVLTTEPEEQGRLTFYRVETGDVLFEAPAPGATTAKGRADRS